MERLNELLEKEILTQEELAEINEMSEVKNIESNGNSGKHHNKTWYTVTLQDDTEYDIYA